MRKGRAMKRLCCLFTLSLAGCAGLWDEVTSRDFQVRHLFVEPDPFVVLQESTDGDHRAKALRALGKRQVAESNPESALQALTKAATTERQPLSRLAAIQSLGRFNDPRAVQGLNAAFESADDFTAETAHLVRCHTLAALGQTTHPDAAALLVRIVNQPATRGTEQDRQHTLDERLAAVRALESVRHPQATEALLQVLRTEKDVALRNRAIDSLETLTGKRLAPNTPEWEQLLAQPEGGGILPATHRPAFGEEFMRRLIHFDWF